VDVRLFNAAKRDKNDIITEIFRSKTVLLGSPTINRGILTSMAALIEEVTGLKFRSKRAAAFGTYGWSGESVPHLNTYLKKAGFELINEGLITLWEPDDRILKQAEEFGKDIARASGV
jgi:anaerobic nitric oxide reductase flavorubredoxin